MAKKTGRPLIKTENLPENWEGLMMDMSSNGASIVEMAVELGISRDTFYALIERDQNFSDTVKKCKEACEAWWLRSGRTGLWKMKDQPELNATLWYMNMKNRFGWADKQQVQHEGAQRIIIEEEIIGGSEDKD